MSDRQVLMWAGIGLIALGPLLAALMLFLGIRYSRKSSAVKRWPSAYGTVLASRVAGISTSEGGTTYQPHVTYQYEVGGQTYQSHSFNVFDLMGGYEGGSKQEAQAKANRYPVGSQVEVRYDPSQPEKSVLETRTPTFMIWFLFGMAVFALCGMVGGGAAMVWGAQLMAP